jgi:hypothetical protein
MNVWTVGLREACSPGNGGPARVPATLGQCICRQCGNRTVRCGFNIRRITQFRSLTCAGMPSRYVQGRSLLLPGLVGACMSFILRRSRSSSATATEGVWHYEVSDYSTGHFVGSICLDRTPIEDRWLWSFDRFRLNGVQGFAPTLHDAQSALRAALGEASILP